MAEVRNVAVGEVHPNPWNPNSMGEEAFNRLVAEIREVGFIDPIQVVVLDDGTYRILGGEHRWKAAKALGLEEIPAVILSEARWQDEDLQKMVTVRLNVLRGKLDPGRMVQLYDDMAKKYGQDALQDLFAYTDSSAWTGMLSSIKRGLKKAGVSKAALDTFDKDAKEARSVEDLSHVLNDLFAKHGDTVDQSYMVFTYGSKEHVYIAMDKTTRAALKKVTNFCRDTGDDINSLVGPALQELASGLKAVKKARKKAAAIVDDDVVF